MTRRSRRRGFRGSHVVLISLGAAGMAAFFTLTATLCTVALMMQDPAPAPQAMGAKASDIRQVHTREAAVQLLDKYARGRRVAAYRMAANDGVVHESLDHHCDMLHGRVLYSRRSQGEFERGSVEQEVANGWTAALGDNGKATIEMTEASEVVTTLGPMALQFFERDRGDDEFDSCVAFLGSAAKGKKRVSGYLCREGNIPMTWDDTVDFLQALEVSGRRVSL
ncbi:MAG: hypothetical protein AAF458_07640 [Pseudomonadota bacterium]